MGHIVIALKGPGTECVTLTTKFITSSVSQDHVYLLSEEFWLIRVSN